MTALEMTKTITLAENEITDTDSVKFNMRQLCKVMDSSENQWLFAIYERAESVLNAYIDMHGIKNLSA